MAAFTLQIPVQVTATTPTPVVVETATLDLPLAGNVAVYGSNIVADEAWNSQRVNEHVTGWKSLYRGWKSHAYAPLGVDTGVPEYLWVPIDAIQIPYRKIAQDFALLTTDASTISILGIGIGADFAGNDGSQTVLLRTAFEALWDYYLENVAN